MYIPYHHSVVFLQRKMCYKDNHLEEKINEGKIIPGNAQRMSVTECRDRKAFAENLWSSRKNHNGNKHGKDIFGSHTGTEL